jgi:beta-lactamase class A
LFLFSPSTEAATLASWRFDPIHNQLDFTTDEIIQPKAQLITNPTRLVIDLPHVELGYPHINYPVGTIVQSIHIGQFNPNTTRLVIELASGYIIDPAQVKFQALSPTHWAVQLPPPQRSPGEAMWPLPSSLTHLPSNLGEPNTATSPAASLLADVIQVGTPMADLLPQVQAVIHRYPSLQSGMFFIDLQTGDYLDIHGDRIFPAASTIKLPILLAFFQDVEAGKVNLNETLVMRRDLIASGSGDMQDRPVGSRFTALQTITKMITISDNTATNMIIDRLGGIERLNQRFQSWGLHDTVIHNWLGDFRGTNKTSPQDLVRVLAMLVTGKLVSASSQQQILDLLHRTTTRTLLPSGLGPGAAIADKTGDIGFLVGDAGIIDMPSGRRYLAGIFVLRPYDDPIVRRFVHEVSHLIYSYLDQSTTASTENFRF